MQNAFLFPPKKEDNSSKTLDGEKFLSESEVSPTSSKTSTNEMERTRIKYLVSAEGSQSYNDAQPSRVDGGLLGATGGKNHLYTAEEINELLDRKGESDIERVEGLKTPVSGIGTSGPVNQEGTSSEPLLRKVESVGLDIAEDIPQLSSPGRSSSKLSDACQATGKAIKRVDFDVLRKTIKDRNVISFYKASKQHLVDPPSIQKLSEASRLMYMKKTLDEVVLSYEMLSYGGLYEVNSWRGNLNDSIDSVDEDEREFQYLFVDEECFYVYENAIRLLMKGNIPKAQKLLHGLAEQLMYPALYARAVVLFKELIKHCDVHNDPQRNAEIMREGKAEIEEAVGCLKFCMDEMRPAGNFVLGMMKAFNVGECCRYISGTWENDLVHVVNVARDHELDEFILLAIDPWDRWDKKDCGVDMKRKADHINKMYKYSLYEFAREILSDVSYCPNVTRRLLEILSKGGDFPEGMYSYAITLIQGKIGVDTRKNMDQAMGLLRRSRQLRHEGAQLLIGVLFLNRKFYPKNREEVWSCIRILERYMRICDDSCAMNTDNVNKASLCLAAEYSSGTGGYLKSDVEKVEEILKLRDLQQEWGNLREEYRRRLADKRSASQLCSTKDVVRCSSFSGFKSDYSGGNKVPIPRIKLSCPSASNGSVSRVFD